MNLPSKLGAPVLMNKNIFVQPKKPKPGNALEIETSLRMKITFPTYYLSRVKGVGKPGFPLCKVHLATTQKILQVASDYQINLFGFEPGVNIHSEKPFYGRGN